MRLSEHSRREQEWTQNGCISRTYNTVDLLHNIFTFYDFMIFSDEKNDKLIK
jgi:hypothetical protein